MEKSIDVTDREKLQALLSSLDIEAKPLWGKMDARLMVEHLVDQVEYSKGKKTTTCDRPAEEAEKDRQLWLHTDIQIPHNLVLKAPTEDYVYDSMETAIKQLMIELNDFDQYLKEPGTTAIHGGFGPMNHHEWVLWHNKHFTHHLRQFDLLEQQ
jgi:oxepin-CoA hydrolase/3-oxo-5,6-dehydrosuberyl-CoA semialdehyde dehydrogenase